MTEKLQKVLARAGIGSRRAMEVAISEGQVSVNGKIATIGDRVSPQDKINYQGRFIRIIPEEKIKPRVLIYHKPEGQICTRSDPEGRETVFERLPRLHHSRWVAVGRLDVNSSGLLLFTNSGKLANYLMHPSSNIDREYAVRILGEVTQAMMQQLRKGVELEDGPGKFKEIKDAGGTGANHWYHVIITEGRQREVRRLWESQGVRVSRLIRIRYGDIKLPPRLKPGRWDEMEPNDVRDLLPSDK